MSLAPLDRTIRWRPVEGVGLEHCHLKRDADGARIRGMIVAIGYGLSYRLRLDANGRLSTADLERTDGKTLALRADGESRWTDGDGTALPALDGCIDIDIWPTPFTNSLPIWRNTWTKGEPLTFSMAWVDGDEMSVRPNGQIYTQIDDAQFRYQSADRSFERILQLDADGLVVEYPGLFTLATA